MKNVTYYLGAGASANALPVVSNMKERIRLFLDYLIADKNKLAQLPTKEFINRGRAINELDKILDKIFKESEKNTTIDTHAKKLYLKEEKKGFMAFKIINISLFYV